MVLKPLNITLIFHGDLIPLLRKKQTNPIIYPLTRRASIKDIIESCGVPHTEIGGIALGKLDIDFDYIPDADCIIDIFSVTTATMHSPAGELLRPPPGKLHFMVDVNVAKLVPLLRMSGVSADLLPVKYIREAARVASLVNQKQCILLTRNRDLLKIREFVHGRLLRSQQPIVQLREVIMSYGLQTKLHPFSRCMACNGWLEKVDKSEIEHRLLPLTRQYYDHFKQCTSCEKIYWQGSHHERMVKIIESILEEDSSI